MGDVNAGELKLFMFFLTFVIVFPMLGYAFTMQLSPPDPDNAKTRISIYDIGGVGFLSVTQKQVERNGIYQEFNIGTGDDTLTIGVSWGPTTHTFQVIYKTGGWWAFFNTYTMCFGALMYDTDLHNHANVTVQEPLWDNMNTPAKTNEPLVSTMHETWIVNNFNHASAFTKAKGSVVPPFSAGSLIEKNTFYIFWQDYNYTRNDLPVAMVEGKVYMEFAKMSSTPTSAGAFEYIGWLINVLTFQQTYGLGAIPLFNYLFWGMIIGAGIAFFAIIKSLATGWI